MIHVTRKKIISDSPHGRFPRVVFRTTVWLFWVIPIFVGDSVTEA